jgi:hypothetical protein
MAKSIFSVKGKDFKMFLKWKFSSKQTIAYRT